VLPLAAARAREYPRRAAASTLEPPAPTRARLVLRTAPTIPALRLLRPAALSPTRPTRKGTVYELPTPQLCPVSAPPCLRALAALPASATHLLIPNAPLPRRMQVPSPTRAVASSATRQVHGLPDSLFRRCTPIPATTRPIPSPRQRFSILPTGHELCPDHKNHKQCQKHLSHRSRNLSRNSSRSHHLLRGGRPCSQRLNPPVKAVPRLDIRPIASKAAARRTSTSSSLLRTGMASSVRISLRPIRTRRPETRDAHRRHEAGPPLRRRPLSATRSSVIQTPSQRTYTRSTISRRSLVTFHLRRQDHHRKLPSPHHPTPHRIPQNSARMYGKRHSKRQTGPIQLRKRRLLAALQKLSSDPNQAAKLPSPSENHRRSLRPRRRSIRLSPKRQQTAMQTPWISIRTRRQVAQTRQQRRDHQHQQARRRMEVRT
jgi:hypothetical protein